MNIFEYNPSPTFPFVLSFARVMESKLAQNRHKGDSDGWRSAGTEKLFSLLRKEVEELSQAIQDRDATAIALEAADVANFAMMVADCASLGKGTI